MLPLYCVYFESTTDSYPSGLCGCNPCTVFNLSLLQTVILQVYADDFLCGKVRYEERIQVYKVGCNSDLVENVIAKNIKIKAADKQFLTLCEVSYC